MAAFTPAQALLTSTLQSAWGDLVRGTYASSAPQGAGAVRTVSGPAAGQDSAQADLAASAENAAKDADGEGDGAAAARRGRGGLVQTSLRGVLQPKPESLKRKSLLGA